MKYILTNEKFNLKSILDNLKDILMELNDIGYDTIVSDFDTFILIDISSPTNLFFKDESQYELVKYVFLRIERYVNELGFKFSQESRIILDKIKNKSILDLKNDHNFIFPKNHLTISKN